MTFNKWIFIIVMMALFSCQEEKIETPYLPEITNMESIILLEDSLKLNPNKGLVYYNGKPFTGTSLSYYEDKKTANSIQYINGKKDGVYKKFFSDGSLSFEANYKNGKREGEVKSWWKNGNLRSKSQYKNGIAEGVQIQWYKSGAKFKRMQLTHGKEEGLQQSWRENGKIYNNYEAKNGRIFGLKRTSLCYELEDEIVQYSN